jgi:hypothetical protein
MTDRECGCYDVPEGLFDASPYYVAPPEPTRPDLSPDQRRTLRQREDIAAKRHPLTRGPLHPFAAPEIASPDAEKGRPFTCGSCRFREVWRYHNRSYPKCVRDLTYGHHDSSDVERGVVALRNVSHGAATDVRAWWPACAGYEAGDLSVSRDAARSMGGT